MSRGIYISINSRFFTFILGTAALLSSGICQAQEPVAGTYPESRMHQKNGLGFGLGLGTMPGVLFFYDHNLDGFSQLHVQADINAKSAQSFFGDSKITATREMLLTTYRYFFTPNSGFYVGAGGGYANSKLEYNSTSIFGGTPIQYSSQMSGIFLLGEVGWQGRDGYYFHVGLQPAGYISNNDNYNENNIPNVSNHRSVANNYHKDLNALSQLSIGFGWFF